MQQRRSTQQKDGTQQIKRLVGAIICTAMAATRSRPHCKNDEFNNMTAKGLRKNTIDAVACFFHFTLPYRNDPIADNLMNIGAIMNVESFSQWRGDCCPSTIM